MHQPEANCFGYVLSQLGLGDDTYYDPNETLDRFFIESGSQPAEVAVAMIGGTVVHIVPYDSNNPNDITHRPTIGAPLRSHDSFFEAIGFYQEAYPNQTDPTTTTRIRFMRRR